MATKPKVSPWLLLICSATSRLVDDHTCAWSSMGASVWTRITSSCSWSSQLPVTLRAPPSDHSLWIARIFSPNLEHQWLGIFVPFLLDIWRIIFVMRIFSPTSTSFKITSTFSDHQWFGYFIFFQNIIRFSMFHHTVLQNPKSTHSFTSLRR